MMMMKLSFNAKVTNGLHAKIQFNFSGDIQGSCHLKIAEGTLDVRQGAVNQPDLTVNSPFDVWMDIITGKAEGQQMFLDQKYTVEGDLDVLMQMEHLFGRTE
jgi:putative sterol carrier protein